MQMNLSEAKPGWKKAQQQQSSIYIRHDSEENQPDLMEYYNTHTCNHTMADHSFTMKIDGMHVTHVCSTGKAFLTCGVGCDAVVLLLCFRLANAVRFRNHAVL